MLAVLGGLSKCNVAIGQILSLVDYYLYMWTLNFPLLKHSLAYLSYLWSVNA
jgi:hypothetical protein